MKTERLIVILKMDRHTSGNHDLENSEQKESTVSTFVNYWIFTPLLQGLRFGIGYFIAIAIIGPRFHRWMKNAQ